MGLFDLFKKKQKGELISADIGNDNKIENISSSNINNSDIEIIEESQGSHGDNFGGLFGFNYKQTQEGYSLINEMISLSAIQNPISENENALIKECDFKETGGNSDQVKVRTVSLNNKVISGFPYLKTKSSLPFQTKRIIEWAHIKNMEAEIIGEGRDTFGLAFFATDYATNKHKYKTNKFLNIKISAFAFVLEKYSFIDPNTENTVGYFPTKQIPVRTCFDFIGKIISFKECVISNDNSGYIINIMLINNADNPNFFNIDIFINKENSRIDKLENGLSVTGVLWFQGEIE